ncbi:unnamed protein product [Brugia pahangi]|uniref:Uncharacterized protein n=1 Tax=Brugia pahangi TaxID=6280 RepID=A0A0N4T7S3_BRUPA|nr:unnamed protein product [Brugia pahangi]
MSYNHESLEVTREVRQFEEICVSDEDGPATAEVELAAVVAEVDALLVIVEDARLVVEAKGDIPLATPKLLRIKRLNKLALPKHILALSYPERNQNISTKDEMMICGWWNAPPHSQPIICVKFVSHKDDYESNDDAETAEADARPVALLSIVFILAELLTDEVLAVERPNTFADSSFATYSPF